MRFFLCSWLALLAIAGSAATAAPASASPTDEPVPLSQLTSSVQEKVAARYPGSYLVEVDGSAPAGPTRDVADVTAWRYVFNDISDGCVCRIMVPAHIDGTVDDFAAQPGIWVGSTTLHPPIGMEPGEADQLLKAAGYDGEYKFVTLRQPNAGAFEPHPLFIFGKFTDVGYIAVDTVTREVKPIR